MRQINFHNVTSVFFFFFSLAGGGGGVDKMKGDSPRCHGATTNDGNPGYGGSQFQGGTGGKGAEEGDNNYSGGGGGGFETNGRSNQNFGGAKGTGGEGGKSFYKCKNTKDINVYKLHYSLRRYSYIHACI